MYIMSIYFDYKSFFPKRHYMSRDRLWRHIFQTSNDISKQVMSLFLKESFFVLQLENNERLSSELSLLKSKLEVERTRYGDLQASLDHTREHAQRQLEAALQQATALKAELADAKRYVRCKR